ncbi:NAD-dependent protein deacetylase, SIR2 family [Noviherbaspirillum humi]|uniref:protein acetyllysine N-acetyltransferase n=1 Tax=Noviherbaspirillum humi TaxID=1688639 RepID=A0A239C4P8_9BURK|nr:NAD-dependent protein deacetylase [Noviherbaspirillum humi]SNS14394.1 NAD-dependent protein deacetylase, SIR2 family [Noviherbaspirillum humi]
MNALAAPADLSRLADFAQRHPGLLLLTGAGVSTASGIPDYRDRDGVRRGRAPIQGPDFIAQEAVRKRYWARSMVGWPRLAQAQPNAAHRAIAELEARGWISAVVTQNVDGLHGRAGSRRLTELHGNIHWIGCSACGSRFERARMQVWLEQANPHLAGAAALPAPDGDAHLEPELLDDFRVPACPHCDGLLKPDVVFFGDGVPAIRAEQARLAMEAADALLVAGSSLMVLSSFRLCRMAAEQGKPIVAVNFGKTRADDLLNFKVDAPAEQALPWLAGQLGKR